MYLQAHMDMDMDPAIAMGIHNMIHFFTSCILKSIVNDLHSLFLSDIKIEV